MTYTPPGPSVTQLLINASQDLAGANLLPCVVGPLYRVKVKAEIASSLPGTSTTYPYPITDAGAVVDLTSVITYAKDAKVKIYEETLSSGTVFVAGSYTINSANNYITADAKAGDILVVDNNGGTYEIAEVSANSLRFTTPILYTVEPVSQKYTIYRNYDYIVPDSGITKNLAGVTVGTGLVYNTKSIVSAKLAVSFRALRKDISGFYRVSNYDKLAADMDIVKDNPIGFVLGNVMLPASGNKETYAYITDDESVVAFNEALSDLQTRQDTYLLIPLTTSSTIKNNFVTHANTMSEPANSYFRVALLSTELAFTKTVSTLTTVSGS